MEGMAAHSCYYALLNATLVQHDGEMLPCVIFCPNWPIYRMKDADLCFRREMGLDGEEPEPIETFICDDDNPNGMWRGLLTDTPRDFTGL